VVTAHEAARDTAETGLTRLVSTLAVIMPSLALLQALANARDYRQPVAAVVVWLAVLGAGRWLVPRLRAGCR
jgi:fructose-specific component phosphotransferase system IIB-like protein